MRSKLRTATLVAFCAAASLAASQCGPSRGSAPADQAPAPGRLEARTWTPESPPDSIARWVLGGCRGRSDKGDCVEKALISVIEPAGVDRAMAALLIVAANDEDIRRDGHVYAHGIGIAAYTSPETVSQAFGRCTTDFQSGCYHGVIQGFFADDRGGTGVTAEKLNALCAEYRTAEKRWLDFQCAHGMGHGLMAVKAHNLLESLDACDLLTDVFERQGCWGGAFMENVVNATVPHHTGVTQTASHDHGGGHEGGHGEAAGGHGAHGDSAGGHDGHGAHGQMAHAAPAEPFKALDPEEPLYPCNVVKEHHVRQCYLMQTSAILFHSNGDFGDAAKQCQRAPETMRETCFQSLGRDANAWGRGSHERAIRNCTAVPEEAQAYCIVGIVKNVVDVTARATDGLEFCKLVPGPTKPACYRAVGQQIALLRPAPAAREAECEAAEPGYLTECRFGAGLGLLRSDE